MTVLRVDTIAASGQTSENTGSVYFDGTGDYLSVDTDLILSTSNFTVEGWVNMDYSSSSSQIHGSSNNDFNLFIETGGNLKFYDGAAAFTLSSSIIPLNTWTHFAVVREGTGTNQTKIYVNGINTENITVSKNWTTAIDILVGRNSTSGTSYANGYISNFRIIKGKALYTENFTVPTRELEVTPETVLVCCHDGENIFAEKTGKIIAAYGDRLSSPTPTATDSPIGITTFQPGLTRSVDVTAGPTLDGDLEFNSQNFFVLPKGTTTEQFPNFAGAPASSARGIFAGGSNPFPTKLNIIDYITISTTGNAQEFGDLTVARGSISGCASNTHGVFGGGQSPSNDNTIDYVTISSTGDAKDFGDLTAESRGGSGLSNSTRGLFGLGQVSTQDNRIDYISLLSTGNAFDFGDLAQAKDQFGSCASPTRGIFAGGLLSPSPVSLTNRIDYVTISTTGNSVEFGDLLQGAADGIRRCGGLSNNTRGIFAGGESTPTGQKDIISYITIASLGDSQDFGDLSDGISQSDNGASSSVRGVFHITNPSNDTLHYVTISTLGNSIDFGNMTNSSTLAGVSNGHGGLG